MGSLGLITAHISKARTPIKTDRAQYGLLGCHSEEQHIQHENQSPPPPHLLVRRSGLPAGDWSGASGKYTGSTKGCGKAKVGNLAGSCKEDRDLCVSAIIVCVCVWVFVGDQRACDLNS